MSKQWKGRKEERRRWSQRRGRKRRQRKRHLLSVFGCEIGRGHVRVQQLDSLVIGAVPVKGHDGREEANVSHQCRRCSPRGLKLQRRSRLKLGRVHLRLDDLLGEEDEHDVKHAQHQVWRLLVRLQQANILGVDCLDRVLRLVEQRVRRLQVRGHLGGQRVLDLLLFELQ